MLINGNALCIPLADKSVQVCVTSPPYYSLRDYSQCECVKFISSDVASSTLNGGGNVHLSNHSQKKNADPNCPYCRGTGRDERMVHQLGLEATPEEFIANLLAVGRELWRVLRDDGTFWLNLGDSYSGSGKARGGGGKGPQSGKQKSNAGAYFDNPTPVNVPGYKPKDLMMIPARVAIALQQAGWYLRAEICWSKLNPMPESVGDRPTRSHEMIYLLTKKPKYYYDAEAVKEKSVWADRDARADGNGKHFSKGKNESGQYAINGVSYGLPDSNGDFFRNQRDVWTLATEPYSGAHFAVMPTEIPRRAILAGTSAKGHCAKCGRGWVRITERKTSGHDWNKNNRNGGNRLESGQSSSEAMSNDYEVKTLGWQPACKCNTDVVPAIVLDPFCGSGTVGEVCRELGRRFVGLDLSMKYLRENAMPRAERSQTPESIARLPLFGGNGDEQLPLKQDSTDNPTYTGFNARWKETHND